MGHRDNNKFDFAEISMEKSWKEAIKRVLGESSNPLHYTEISELVLSRGYYETDGATPMSLTLVAVRREPSGVVRENS